MGCCNDHSHQGADGAATCPQCGFDPFVRNHFFTGKMMGTAEFRTESEYHAEKMRHHNIRLHGVGVVCGLKVHHHPSPDCQKRYVVVEPGSALDCCGHEILVAQEEIIDVAMHPAVQKLAGDDLLHTLQICVRWRECPTEEVPVLYDECGCDDTQSAPNRILESFEFDVLVDPPLPPANTLPGKAAGVFVTTDQHAVTGFMRAGADGKVAVIDPADANRLLILDPARRSMLAVVRLPAPAKALTSSPTHAFVIVAPDTQAECAIRIYSLGDGSEVLPANGPGPRLIPGTGAGTPLFAAVSSEASRALLVLDGASNKLFAWKADAAHAIDDLPSGPHALATQGVLGFTVRGDGALAYVADGQGLSRIDLAAQSPASVPIANIPGPTATNRMSMALSDSRVWVAKEFDKTIYVFDDANPATLGPIRLSHPVSAIATVGDRLQVLEWEGGSGYVQSVDLDTASGNSTPVAAPRKAGTAPAGLLVVSEGGQSGAVSTKDLAEGNCADLVWNQIEGCPACDAPDCTILATITGYQPGVVMHDPRSEADSERRGARIDNQLGRRVVASTETLQSWLECLRLRGGIAGPAGRDGRDGKTGTDGKDGLDGKNGVDGSDGLNGTNGIDGKTGTDGKDGLDGKNGVDGNDGLNGTNGIDGKNGTDGKDGVDGQDGKGLELGLVQIRNLSWTHNQNRQSLVDIKLLDSNMQSKGLWVGFTEPVFLADHGTQFLTPRSFEVLVSSDEAVPTIKPITDRKRRNDVIQNTAIGKACLCPLTGIVVPIELNGPNATEITSSFSRIWAFVFSKPATQLLGNVRQLRIRIFGDFVIAEDGRAADVEFARADLPTGDRPFQSATGVQGGVFESWLWLLLDNERPLGQAQQLTSINTVNDPASLTAIPGISRVLAKRLIKERIENGNYKSLDDLASRNAVCGALMEMFRNAITTT